MEPPTPTFAIRASSGVQLSNGPPDYKAADKFAPGAVKDCHTMLFSSDGKYFAWAGRTNVTIVTCSDWTIAAELKHQKVLNIAFSPKCNHLMLWEPFAVSNANPQGSPNLHIYSTADWTLVKSFVYKKQSNWMPQWSTEENLCAKMVNNDIVFYENCNFERIVHRINFAKIESFSLAPGASPHNVLCYTKGTRGQPSFARLFRYPKLDGQQALANKGFFQADRVDFHWNCRGSSALIVATAEVDVTGASYYQKSTLHYMATNGDTAMINFDKEGPLHNVAWSPKGNEFCAVYGYMPSKASIYNLKCEPVFDLGTAPRNAIYYNPHGNMLLLAGFGNLRGQVEVWDLKTRKLINKCEMPDTTLLQWSPNGVHFLTATTAPRLRIGNGYKIWHYSCSLLHHCPWNDQSELYEVCWQTYGQDKFPEPVISHKHVAGIKISEPQVSKQVYRPPAARARFTAAAKPDHPSQKSRAQNLNAPTSKAAQKRKKEKEAPENKKVESANDSEVKENTRKAEPKSSSVTPDFLTGDPETDKKIRNIKKKLDAIVKLKEQQANGKTLEINQIAKIKTEDQLLKEFNLLKMG